MIDQRGLRHFDFILLLLAVALVAYGAILIYSASLTAYPDGITPGHPLVKQITFAVLGLGISIGVAWLDYRMWGQMSTALYILAVFLLVAVLGVGNSAYGSTRWFSVGGQQIQASEIAKILVIIALARFMADHQHEMHDLRIFGMTLAMAAVPAGLVLIEPDMGTAMVFGATWMGMVLISGAPVRFVMVLVGLGVSLIPFATLALMGDYQRERFATWIDPNHDPLGGGFNILQSEIGIGSGGWLGKGLTHGSQTQLDFLQTSTTDYIFSVLGEELGLLGALILFALFILLLFRGIRAASISQDPFGRLLATGIVIMILFQTTINVAVNIRLLPVTGIPLPFVSQGGSSLIMLFGALGLIESVVIRHKRIEF
ncbi:MAG TPA: rod shape-determining protein RodA [Dehalococcoidia bacterium]|nr:rod shape-determining protein RodA [Dehalococcoidia bacterium]